MQALKRHPNVPNRSLALPEELVDQQVQRGLYTVDRGVTYALPIDHVKRKEDWRHRDVWRHDKEQGTYRRGSQFRPAQFAFQGQVLTWLRDHVNESIPHWYYMATLGHDLHVSMRADLYAKHWHAGWADPITGAVTPSLDPWFTSLFATHWVDHECDLNLCPRDSGITIGMLQGLGGFVEDLGLLSSGKISDVFINVTVGALVDSGGAGEAAEFNDFNEHEVGTNAQAENNNDTALITTSGIALQAGTQTDSGGDPIVVYQTVATITADATETWNELGIFSTGTDSLLDRNTTGGGQSVNNADTVQYTWDGSFNPEA